MKLVINKCFGGFGLSPLATKELAKAHGRKCYFFTNIRDKNGKINLTKLGKITLKEAEAAFFWMAYDHPKGDEAEGEHYIDHGHQLDRADPKLVEIVERLGNKANGSHAELSIIEIPDGTEYTIEEYDGMEHVAEVHRTWY